MKSLVLRSDETKVEGFGHNSKSRGITLPYYQSCVHFKKQADVTNHDVGVSIEELDKFLQTPEAALETAQQELGKLILVEYQTLELVVKVLQQHSDDLNDGENERPKGQSTCVIPAKTNSHLPQCCDKVSAPEEQEDIVELQCNQVLVVNCLPSIESKKALRVWTLCFHKTR
uniref:Uncharacterized protein n=1 Tax=Periophthalmus magnuspinnatus TaxID=409849 RepID=A0A3B3ZAE1_9GOBI